MTIQLVPDRIIVKENEYENDFIVQDDRGEFWKFSAYISVHKQEDTEYQLRGKDGWFNLYFKRKLNIKYKKLGRSFQVTGATEAEVMEDLL